MNVNQSIVSRIFSKFSYNGSKQINNTTRGKIKQCFLNSIAGALIQKTENIGVFSVLSLIREHAKKFLVHIPLIISFIIACKIVIISNKNKIKKENHQ